MHIPLLQEILILLGFSVVIVFVLNRLKLPSIVGLLLTGVVIGPYGLSLINAIEEVEILSEIGVILLLFVIGLELSFKQLATIKKTVFLGGLTQVSLTVLVSAGIFYFLDHSWEESVFIGFLFSLSSTAIVLATLTNRQEISAPYARNALGILIFQDIIVVPMMLITPMIAGENSDIIGSSLTLLLKTSVLLILTFLGARYVVPTFLHAVAKTNSKELFLLVTITLCFAVAYLTSEAGLSLALGAFIAGVIVSESEYSHQATSIILPFRELFTSFFFVSIGMLLDFDFFLDNIATIVLLVFVVLVLKSSIASFAVAILGYPPKTVILTGLALFQVGEFAFILSKVGIDYDLLTPETNQYFLSISIFSMMLTPIVIIFSEDVANRFLGVSKKLGIDPDFFTSTQDLDSLPDQLENHLVIVGYGLNGSNLAKAASTTKIPYVIVELSAETVRRERLKGIPIFYGDATNDHILELAGVANARAVVVAISNKQNTRTIIKNIRDISSTVYVVVRTKYVREIAELNALGADEVVPEEFETSLLIFTHVLHNFLVPEDEIDQMVNEIRGDNYQFFKSGYKRPKPYRPYSFMDFNINCLHVNTDSTKIVGKTLKELDIRSNYGINILGIQRRKKMIQNIQSNDILKQGDYLYVQGNPIDIEQFNKMIT